MNIIIADDEPLARENMRLLLERFHPQHAIVAECADASEVLLALTKYNVQLLLLDIEMPGKSGIQLASEIQHLSLNIVFVTAHNEYAIKAFRVSALDYLLKPVDPLQLAEALSKCEGMTKKVQSQQLQLYQQSLHQPIERVALPTWQGLDICRLSDIVCFIAEESYTHVHLNDKTNKLISRKLGELEELLATSGFIRVHKSYMVNVSHIKKYIKGEGGQVEMSNGMLIDVARRKKDELLEKLNRL
jgi:two-component system LytT family response regulator